MTRSKTSRKSDTFVDFDQTAGAFKDAVPINNKGTIEQSVFFDRFIDGRLENVAVIRNRIGC